MTDNAQLIVNTYAYSPFGIVTDQNETIPNPFKYVGQYGVVAEPNGLYYMRARFYNPYFGRFISEDPIGFGGGDVNLYAYVQNNPVNAVDPSRLIGLKTKLRLQILLIKFLKGANAVSPFSLEILNSQTAVRQLLKVNPVTGAVTAVLLDPKHLSGPYLGEDDKWYLPDGTPFEFELFDYTPYLIESEKNDSCHSFVQLER